MQPSGLLLFGIMFVMIVFTLALFWVISRTKAWLRGERFITVSRLAAHRDQRSGEQSEPERARSPDGSRMNHAEPERTAFAEPFALTLNADEVAAVQKMILHKAAAQRPSKSSAIMAGFGVSRGGSGNYIRASEIYDALFGPPEPAVKYRPLTPEQEATRKALGLSEH